MITIIKNLILGYKVCKKFNVKFIPWKRVKYSPASFQVVDGKDYTIWYINFIGKEIHMIEDEHTPLNISYTDEDKEHWAYSTPESNKEYEARMLSNERKSFWKMFIWVNIILACVCFSGAVFGKDCSEWNKLSSEQKYRLEYAYTYGKSHDLGWTMSSIALVESQAGLYKINPVSKDYGLFQINENNIYAILGVTSYWEKRKIITKVVVDDTLSAYLALDVLQHFQRVHKGNWKKMVMSYNIGNNKSEKYLKRGIDYYEKVVYHLNILKQCSNFN